MCARLEWDNLAGQSQNFSVATKVWLPSHGAAARVHSFVWQVCTIHDYLLRRAQSLYKSLLGPPVLPLEKAGSGGCGRATSVAAGGVTVPADVAAQRPLSPVAKRSAGEGPAADAAQADGARALKRARRDAKSGLCFHCGKPGHLRKDCPALARDGAGAGGA